MNIKEFFKRDNLDEMQKQTLLKIESRGFWVLWVLLLAALIIESLLGFAPREMAAEWFIFRPPPPPDPPGSYPAQRGRPSASDSLPLPSFPFLLL